MEPDISPVCVLVVDDNEGHSELVRRNLRRAGITNEIVAVNSGELALDFVYSRGAYAERRTYNGLLILLDINMPGIDGVEVLRTLKMDPKKARIPVVMLTTTDDPREIKRCYEFGCSVYIVKPVLPEAFMDAIKKLGLFISIVELPREKGE
jgi:CheY-like chemotaxis protein